MIMMFTLLLKLIDISSHHYDEDDDVDFFSFNSFFIIDSEFVAIFSKIV